MNGLANAILTLLLSWLRIIVNRIWSAVNSETGGHFLNFLAEHWPVLLLILGIGGFVLDKLIYLIRWRPFRVRRYRRERLAMADDYEQQADWGASADDRSAYAPPAYDLPAEPQPEEPAYWDEAAYAAAAYDAPADPTAVYSSAPAAQTAIYAHPSVDHSAYHPLTEDIHPVFDDQVTWANGDMLLDDQIDQHPAAAQFVSQQYVQDVHAGFARPVQPEQLYAPPAQANIPGEQQPNFPEAQPVHPGLDVDLLRRNMGLAYSGEPLEDAFSSLQEQPVSVAFTPFTKKADPEPAPKKRNPFLNLMRLVGDDDAKPSIRDLQSSVDVRNAFREPVYPQPLYRNEDDPS